MKTILTLVFVFVTLFSNAQDIAGKEEYDKAIIALAKNQDKKANKLLEESYKKGYEPACLKIQDTKWGSVSQRLEAKKIGAEKGNSRLMFLYGVENIDNIEVIEYYSLKTLATSSIQEAYDYINKAAKAGYEPAYIYLGEKAIKAGDIINAIKIYQLLGDKGNKEALYKVAILKKDAKAAFEAIEDIKKDPLYNYLTKSDEMYSEASQYNGFTRGDGIYDAANLGNDSKFAFEAAKIFSEKAVNSGTQSRDSYEQSAGFLYARACELGNGEGCYRRGLDYLSDYRGHENGMKLFDKAIALGYKVPETDYLKMKNPPSAEDIKQVDKKLEYQIEQSAKWAKNHPNEDEPEVKENTANNKTKSSLTQSDMDKIIKANSPSSTSEDDRHRKEMEKQARDAEKIKNGTWNGH